MTIPRPGITFSETMSGPFALEISDPNQLEQANSNSISHLSMHATIDIDDIDRFVSDPNHSGSLKGHIDFTPLGKNLPSTKGVFNLFAPVGSSKETRMIYELGFEANGKSYYLAGHKIVRDDPGFDLWSDTTTLYTTLYEGSDKTGKAIGAGILKLGMTDLMKLVSTMRATNTDSLGDKAAAVAKFGKFFMGELWQTYGIAK